jgi:hypothetical protein
VRVLHLTLLLGLITGPQTIELAVEGDPRWVEILFDDQRVLTLEGPPWIANLDFGIDPLPCEVVARAIDADGREIARAAQRVNLPHERESLQIALERDGAGSALAASVVWQSAEGLAPDRMTLELDGRSLPLTDGRALLPRLDPDARHVLEARAESATGVRATAILTGGAYGDQVTTELTAIALRSTSTRGQRRPASCLADPSGTSVEVQAVDDAGAEVFLVASRESRYALRRQMITWHPRRTRGPYDPASDLLRLPLPRRTRVTFFWPEIATHSRGLGAGRTTELFSHSGALDIDGRDFWSRVRETEPSESSRTTVPRIADATGVAVMAAASSGRRRVVVVVVADEADASRFRPEQILALARQLHVPVQIWSLSDAPTGAWGPSIRLARSAGQLRLAHLRLHRELENQRIAWVRSSIPLHRIQLRPDCPGLQFAD